MTASHSSDTGNPVSHRQDDRGTALIRLLQVVAMAANEATNIESALATCLNEVCAYTGWPVGHAYLLEEEAGDLVPTGVWCLSDAARFRRFREKTEATRLERGRGLLGTVLATGKPTWIADVSQDASFVRGSKDDIGIRAGRAFPIMSGQEVLGVLEFYSAEAAPVDEALLQTMSQIGVQIGRVVERVRAEKALRLSEAKFSGIITISSDAIVSIDDEQRITLFNQGAERIFGYTAGEVLGRPLDVLIPERFHEVHRAQVQQFGDGPSVSRKMGERGEISGQRKNGEIFPADASISKLEVDGRRIYTAVLRDVTERVRAAEELARSNSDLEQFAYVASHDLQEPLRMVASYTQLLARRYRGRLDADADEFISFAVDGVKRMQALINDLLAFSRVGTRGEAFEPTDTNDVMARVLRDLGTAIQDAGAEVTHEPLPTITADAVQLGQVFQNLLSNAIKFRPPDRIPRVHVSARRDHSEWIFSVADNGIGIEPEYAERIFLLFQRLHGRDEYPGTGIGLAICRKIVERHGGRIWFDSTPGRGTTFHFSVRVRPGAGT